MYLCTMKNDRSKAAYPVIRIVQCSKTFKISSYLYGELLISRFVAACMTNRTFRKQYDYFLQQIICASTSTITDKTNKSFPCYFITYSYDMLKFGLNRFNAKSSTLVNQQLMSVLQFKTFSTEPSGHYQIAYRPLLSTVVPIKSRCGFCTHSPQAVKGKLEITQEGLLKRFVEKLGFSSSSKTRLRVASHILYESVADQINYLNFFRDFDLPNTFNSWFLVTELHVWMLLNRAMAEGDETGENGRILRNFIVEAMWRDVNARAKKLGVQNYERSREQIEMLSEQFQAALIAYDEGISSSDTVLAAALWRRFFEMKCDNFVKIELLVKYVRQQVTILDQIERKDFSFKSKIPWLDIQKINLT